MNKSVRNIVVSCLQKGMNLKTSPPFIVQLANETKEYLFNIMIKTPNILEQNTYLQEFVTNFMSKCKEIEGIFKDFGKEMCNPTCEGRKRLIKKSLIFSYVLPKTFNSQLLSGICTTSYAPSFQIINSTVNIALQNLRQPLFGRRILVVGKYFLKVLLLLSFLEPQYPGTNSAKPYRRSTEKLFIGTLPISRTQLI